MPDVDIWLGKCAWCKGQRENPQRNERGELCPCKCHPKCSNRIDMDGYPDPISDWGW